MPDVEWEVSRSPQSNNVQPTREVSIHPLGIGNFNMGDPYPWYIGDTELANVQVQDFA